MQVGVATCLDRTPNPLNVTKRAKNKNAISESRLVEVMTCLDDTPVFSVRLVGCRSPVLALILHLAGQELSCDWVYGVPQAALHQRHLPFFITPAGYAPCTACNSF